MSEHLGDLASLYALGALDDSERAIADDHLAHCDACVRLIAQAEASVAAMAEAQALYDVPPALDARVAKLFSGSTAPVRRSISHYWASAVAAVLVVSLVPSTMLYRENVHMRDAMMVDASAMARMTAGPHRMVAFTGSGASGAKVVYGSDGSWYCIIIKGASAPLHVMWAHDGQQTALGTTETHGDVAMLYLPQSHRMDKLALYDGEHEVGEAKLVF